MSQGFDVSLPFARERERERERDIRPPLIPLIPDKCPPQSRGTMARPFRRRSVPETYSRGSRIVRALTDARFSSSPNVRAKMSRGNRKRKDSGGGRKFIALLSAGSAHSAWFGKLHPLRLILLRLPRDRDVFLNIYARFFLMKI